MKKIFLVCCLIIAVSWTAANAQEDDEDVVFTEMKELEFLLGEWRTASTFVDSGEEGSGLLIYESVLGGAWILCRFKGEAPGRDIWEAYAMFTFDPETGRYRSYAFFGGSGPATYTGFWKDNSTVVFTNDGVRPNGMRDRINYTALPDGNVFQLNEVEDKNGEWQEVLKTWYRPIPNE